MKDRKREVEKKGENGNIGTFAAVGRLRQWVRKQVEHKEKKFNATFKASNLKE